MIKNIFKSSDRQYTDKFEVFEELPRAHCNTGFPRYLQFQNWSLVQLCGLH